GAIRDLDDDLAVGIFHQGWILQVITEEKHSLFPGPFIQGFPFPIGPQIPVEDVDILLRIHLFQPQGTLHGMGTANLAAIGPVRDAGAHTLDEGYRAGVLDPLAFLGYLPIQIQGKEDIGILLIEKLAFWLIRFTSGGKNDDAVMDLLTVRGERRNKVTHDPVDLGNLGP